MDSFKIYLPSNASYNHYPDNNASDFQTYLDNPIRLEGAWEVGAESIYYNSQIGNKEEKANIFTEAITKTYFPMHDHGLKVSKDNKWLGLNGFYPSSLPNDTKDIRKILAALNSINDQLLEEKEKPLFEFSIHNKYKDHIQFKSFNFGLKIQISDKMADCLGFKNFTTLSSYKRRAYYPFANPCKETLTREDFKVHVFLFQLLTLKSRIVIKEEGERFLTQDEFLKRWNNRVRKKYDAELVKTSDDSMLHLDNKAENTAILPSYSLAYFFRNSPILRPGITKISYPTDPKDREPINYRDAKWYVYIYGDELKKYSLEEVYQFDIPFLPRKYSKVEDFIKHLDKQFLTVVKMKLKDRYDPTLHLCRFTVNNNYTQIEVGSQLQIKLSDNLKFILGFISNNFESGTYLSTTLPATLDQRDQQLFIHADFIHPVSYGSRKEFIMQQFIHDKEDDYGIVEKRFEPISFIPVARNYMDTIHIKITNESFQPIEIRDSKTILVLHFRKVK